MFALQNDLFEWVFVVVLVAAAAAAAVAVEQKKADSELSQFDLITQVSLVFEKAPPTDKIDGWNDRQTNISKKMNWKWVIEAQNEWSYYCAEGKLRFKYWPEMSNAQFSHTAQFEGTLTRVNIAKSLIALK